ncbi:MAG: hypothetical protein COV73_06555 [Candidatus Omnitrophica bacterium CG11_big_fil_rev_8_21_14_0_20_43_6]|nr:MAG: hypothetical protein COV73_06555 [Candidatus Omnitrophica bacterium CG11_big_fil_rev_8_21_14_0_20_43_6]
MAAEETKCCSTEKACCDPKKAFSTLLKVILGLGFLVIGGWGILRFWPELIVIIKGGIGPFLVLVGVITLAIAKE